MLLGIGLALALAAGVMGSGNTASRHCALRRARWQLRRRQPVLCHNPGRGGRHGLRRRIRVRQARTPASPTRSGIKQVVFVNKGLTLRGGFTTANWATPNPAANLTTVDAEGWAAGVVISGTVSAAPAVTVEGLRITGGNATGLGGYGGADTAGRRRRLRLPGPGDAAQLHDLPTIRPALLHPAPDTAAGWLPCSAP